MTRRLRDTKNHSVYQCENCKLYQLSPLPADEEIYSFYNSRAHSIEKTAENELKWKELVSSGDTRRRADAVSKLMPAGFLLDYGFGYGFFLRTMAQKGYWVTGVELSRLRIDSAKGILPSASLYGDLRRVPDASQNIVTTVHVLEHVTNPVGLLEKLTEKLKAGGLLVVEVPNVNDHLLKRNRAYFDFYWKRAHLSYFNADTLRQCIGRAGLNVKSLQYVQRWSLANAIHWIISNGPQPKNKVAEQAVHSKPLVKWFDRAYKNYLIKRGAADTILAVCGRRKT